MFGIVIFYTFYTLMIVFNSRWLSDFAIAVTGLFGLCVLPGAIPPIIVAVEEEPILRFFHKITFKVFFNFKTSFIVCAVSTLLTIVWTLIYTIICIVK